MPQLPRSIRLRAAAVALALLGAFAVTAAAGSAPASADGPKTGAGSSREISAHQRQVIHQATKGLRSPAAAQQAGFVATDACVELPGVGGMGFHYVNYSNLLDGVIDPAKPEVLVFVPSASGRTLGAVEYLGVDPDQDVTTDDGRPWLFGTIPFDGPMLGHEPGMPVHYDLHVWLYRHNPAGMLAPWNPAVSC